MALVFEQFLHEAIGDASYLVGDDSARVAAVVDPQVDIRRYVEAARRHAIALKYVIQTHIHEDFLSGATALANAAGGAEVCASGHDAPEYGYAHRKLYEGDRFELGKIALTVKHTPGHTPEHIALLVAKAGQEASPFAVFSGGSLLVDAAGRTDLLGPERTDEMTRAQFRTLRDFFLALDDGVAVYPTHVHGSPCGAAIGDKASTTLGYERRHNPLLRPENEEAFREVALAGLPPKPRYYPRLKERNTVSQPTSGATSPVPALPPDEFKQALSRKKAVLLDTRHLLAFGGGHIPGALNIGMTGHLGIWAGWMLEADEPLLVVLDSDDRLEKVVGELARTGFERFDGYLVGGMSAWENRGFPLQPMRQVHVDQLAKDRSAFAILDVRSPQEWHKGRVPGARHIFLADLPGQLKALDKGRPLAVYCDSGYRASIGASLLQREGFDASVVPGSWQAWTACDLPVEKGRRTRVNEWAK